MLADGHRASSAPRGFALGIRQTAVVAGSATAALGLPVAVDHGSSQTALLMLAVGVFAAGFVSLVGLRSPPTATSGNPQPLRMTLENRLLWRLCLGSALLVVTQVAVLSLAVLFLHDHRGLSARAAAGVLAIMQVIGGALRILVGRWSDRLGRRSAPLVRLAAAVAVSLAATAAVVDAPLLLLLPVFIAAGALSASWNGLAFTAAGELAGPAAAGAAIGLQQASLALAAAITPVVLVAIVDTASWTAAFAAGCVAGVLATGALVRLSASERAA